MMSRAAGNFTAFLEFASGLYPGSDVGAALLRDDLGRRADCRFPLAHCQLRQALRRGQGAPRSDDRGFEPHGSLRCPARQADAPYAYQDRPPRGSDTAIVAGNHFDAADRLALGREMPVADYLAVRRPTPRTMSGFCRLNDRVGVPASGRLPPLSAASGAGRPQRLGVIGNSGLRCDIQRTRNPFVIYLFAEPPSLLQHRFHLRTHEVSGTGYAWSCIWPGDEKVSKNFSRPSPEGIADTDF